MERSLPKCEFYGQFSKVLHHPSHHPRWHLDTASSLETGRVRLIFMAWVPLRIFLKYVEIFLCDTGGFNWTLKAHVLHFYEELFIAGRREKVWSPGYSRGCDEDIISPSFQQKHDYRDTTAARTAAQPRPRAREPIIWTLRPACSGPVPSWRAARPGQR